MAPIEEIYPFLSQPCKVVIIMHQKPDADAMGSSLGLYHFLRLLGHEEECWYWSLLGTPGSVPLADGEGKREVRLGKVGRREQRRSRDLSFEIWRDLVRD